MGQLSDSALSFMRWITNCLEDPPCGHAAFLHYWSRRLVVAFTATQMQFLLARQRKRDPCFSYVSEDALYLDSCDAHMPGGSSCDGTSSRFLRCDAAVIPPSCLPAEGVLGPVRDKRIDSDNSEHRHQKKLRAYMEVTEITTPTLLDWEKNIRKDDHAGKATASWEQKRTVLNEILSRGEHQFEKPEENFPVCNRRTQNRQISQRVYHTEEPNTRKNAGGMSPWDEIFLIYNKQK